ncbi:hypothetical protein TGPRC2_224940 [Toxoplasma gondii TgCatPRC2]|uniref:RNase NYN domain-containing protein n=1 Tax=Toxoplasma gondii TgCatPRC2 TaxID=1130821 RepID=A0A151HR86_TOXGO|nr:hypothetical protein TGPRC2_224940 [Toxoplasma gondii TgCatPRC2]
MAPRRGRTLTGGRRRGSDEVEGQRERGGEEDREKREPLPVEYPGFSSEGRGQGQWGGGEASVSAGRMQGDRLPNWWDHQTRKERAETDSHGQLHVAETASNAPSTAEAFKDDCLNDEALELLLKSGAFLDTTSRDGDAELITEEGSVGTLHLWEAIERSERACGEWTLRDPAQVKEEAHFENEEATNWETQSRDDGAGQTVTQRNRRRKQGLEREAASVRRQGDSSESLFLLEPTGEKKSKMETRRRGPSGASVDAGEGRLSGLGATEYPREGLWQTQKRSLKARSRRKGDSFRPSIKRPVERQEHRTTAASVLPAELLSLEDPRLGFRNADSAERTDRAGERRNTSKGGGRKQMRLRRCSCSSRSCGFLLSETEGDVDFYSAFSDLGDASDGTRRDKKEEDSWTEEEGPEQPERILDEQERRSESAEEADGREAFFILKDEHPETLINDASVAPHREPEERMPLHVLIQQRWETREHDQGESEAGRDSGGEGWLPATKFSRRSQQRNPRASAQDACAPVSGFSLAEREEKRLGRGRAKTLAAESRRKSRFVWLSSSSSDDGRRTSSGSRQTRGRPAGACSSRAVACKRASNDSKPVAGGSAEKKRTPSVSFSVEDSTRDRDRGAGVRDEDAQPALLWRAWPTPEFPLSPARESKGPTPLLLDGTSIAFEHGRQRRLSPLGVAFALARVFELGFPAKVLLPSWMAGEEHFYPTFFVGSAKGVALWQQIRQALQEDGLLIVLPDPNAHLPKESHARWYPTRNCFKSCSDALKIAGLCKQWGAALCSNDFEQFLRLVVGQKNKKMAEIYDFVSRSSVLLAFHKNQLHLILDSQGRGSSLERLILRTGER